MIIKRPSILDRIKGGFEGGEAQGPNPLLPPRTQPEQPIQGVPQQAVPTGQPEQANAPQPQPGTGQGQVAPPKPKNPISPMAMKQAEEFKNMALEVIHGKKTRKTIENSLRNNKDNPVVAVSGEAIKTIARVEDAATVKGHIFEPDAVVIGGMVVLNELIDVGEAAGFFKLDEQTQAETAKVTTNKYVFDSIKSGKTSKEYWRGVSKELEQVMAQTPQEQPQEMAQGPQPLMGGI